HGVVVGAVIAESRDVGVRAVAEGRGHLQRYGLVRLLEGVFRRRDGDLFDVTAALGPARAIEYPLSEDTVLPGILGEANGPAVLHLPGRLEQQQAIIRIAGGDAASQAFARDGKVILLRLVTKQRQPKTALALERPV